MNLLRLSWIGIFSFFSTLFHFSLKKNDRCSRGHQMVESWSHCPDCEILKKLKTPVPVDPVYLFCTDGAHQGETFVFSKGSIRIGADHHADCVLTPVSFEPTSICLTNRGTVTLSGKAGDLIQMNGVDKSRDHLLDYDQVSFMGNQFLVLTLPNLAKEEV